MCGNKFFSVLRLCLHRWRYAGQMGTLNYYDLCANGGACRLGSKGPSWRFLVGFARIYRFRSLARPTFPKTNTSKSALRLKSQSCQDDLDKSVRCHRARIVSIVSPPTIAFVPLSAILREPMVPNRSFVLVCPALSCLCGYGRDDLRTR